MTDSWIQHLPPILGRLKAWVPALIALMLLGAASPAQVVSSPGIAPINVTNRGYVIRSANVVGNAADDLIVGGLINFTVGGQVTIVRNRGANQSPTFETILVPHRVSSIQTADLNADGMNDIVVVGTATNSVFPVAVMTVFLSRGHGVSGFDLTFHSYPNLNTYGEDFDQLKLVDVDADGDLDAAWDREIIPNLGSGVFGTAYTINVPGTGTDYTWEWGDFDGDGLADLVSPLGNQIARWEVSPILGELVFQGFSALPTAPLVPVFEFTPLVAADFNGDGIDDLLVSYLGATAPTFTPYQHNVRLGSATAPFSTGLQGPMSGAYLGEIFGALTDYARPQGLDLDNDGIGELIATDAPGGFAMPLPPAPNLVPLNYGPGGFVPSSVQFPGIRTPYAETDFNGDGLNERVSLGGVATNTLFFAGSTDVDTPELSIISGSLITDIPDGDITTLPIVIELRDELGLPMTGKTLTLSELPLEAGIIGAAPLVTDALGQVSFQIQAPDSAHYFSFRLQYVDAPSSNALIFEFNRAPDFVLELTDGDLGFATLGRESRLEILVTDLLNGLPAAGVALEVSASSGTSITSNTAPISDANGSVIVRFVPGVAGEGSVTVALADAREVSVVSSFAIRRLSVSFNPFSGMVFVGYEHENDLVPLVLAAEPASVLSPFEQTPFGDIFTSICNPQPSLAVLDSASDPSVMTPFMRQFPYPVSLIGTNLAVQAYALDSNYSFPHNIVISNPVLFEL